MADLDLYGDLVGDMQPSPAPSPLASPGPAEETPLASAMRAPTPAMSPPAMSPPAGSPPAMSPPGLPALPGPSPSAAPTPEAPVWEDWAQGPDESAADGPRDPRERPQDFEALSKELLADEQGGAPGSPGSPQTAKGSLADTEDEGCVSDATEEEGAEGQSIQLDEIKASETGAKYGSSFMSPRKWRPTSQGNAFSPGAPGAAGASMKRKEQMLFIGPPPPAPPGSVTAECLLLVGGLPWWLTDVELRSKAEHFGQIRFIRILDHERSGKSAGIALVAFASSNGAKQASRTGAEGLSGLPAWDAMAVVAPRLVLVSYELQGRVCGSGGAGLSWAEGGPCSEELRTILTRQFDVSHKAPAPSRRGREPSPRGHRRKADEAWRPPSGRGEAPPRGSPDRDKPKSEVWTDTLKKLRANVNSR